MTTATVQRAAGTSRRSSGFARFWQRNKYAYLFLAPWLIGLLVWETIPFFSSFGLAFTDYDLSVAKFVGTANFSHMFSADPRYIKALQVTFTYVFVGVPLQLLAALTLAFVLHRELPGLPIFRGVFYLPSLMGGSVAIALLWRRLFGYDGVANALLGLLGIHNTPPISWVSDPRYAIYTLILLLVWQFGSPMIVFLAGLKQIPNELYEAAAIDGATTRASFFRITLPLLTPVIFFNMVMQIISAFQAFTPAFIVGGGSTGGPLDSLLFYTLYLYFKAFQEFKMGYASAMAWILLLITAFFTAVIFATSGKWVFYSE